MLNRFLMQAAIGHPLTVHGTGGQTRAFIHIRDTVRCIELAVNNPPEVGERVSVFNQTTEVHRVRDLAALVSKLTGAEVVMLPNPRREAAENDLVVRNDRFLALGLNPTTLSEGLLEEVRLIASEYRDRVDPSKIAGTLRSSGLSSPQSTVASVSLAKVLGLTRGDVTTKVATTVFSGNCVPCVPAIGAD